MIKNFLKENKGFMVVGIITIILVFIALRIPTSSHANDFLAKFGSLVTILGAAISYLAWSNTQKLIIRRKNAVLKTEKNDVIVGITALRQETGIEDQIIRSTENGLKELQDLVNGSKISILVNGNEESNLRSPNSVFAIKVSNKINRGIIIDTPSGMPVDDPNQLKKFIDDYRSTIGYLYGLLVKSNCKTVHLFYAVPVSLAPFIMPYFVNKMTVIAYHWDVKEKKYIKLGPIDDR